MKKIPTLFLRNYDGDRLVRDEVAPGCEWVIAGEGVATIKWDGTACLIQQGKLYKRYELKSGKQPPKDFLPAQLPDVVTGEIPGWVPVADGPEDRWHRAALGNHHLPNGTYELCGPKVQGDPGNFGYHILIPHRDAGNLVDAPCDFAGLKHYLATLHYEGIVWHHPDGRMVKLKRKDFGFQWPIKPKA